ncbi:hypothetical protein GCM10009116_00300 [Brevundimonas basaltis]|uniref:Uncharacterized protein n=1 Tax=Brevundimonas basaltis TaxID=472166 RepID=A0A7W8MI60_9CAUL|nr:hypothetical protein [Brevundimonas basaltis]MBB5292947.1 hypothetical protein [Brevundimonas basaltis]
MRLTLSLAAALAAGVMAFPATAEDSQYEAALRRMIAETAAGTCPADIMGEGLLAACELQLPQMSAGLSSLGAIESVTFVRAEDRPGGRVEIYAVTFAGGQTLNWGIGGLNEGKFNVAYTAG